MKKILAVDGNSILNRAFYGIKMLNNSEGFPTNALFGMVNILEKQIGIIKPDCAVIAYDLKAPTFRHKMYGEYKAGRHAMPEELVQQMPVSREFAKAMGFHIVTCEGYEADDILGTVAKMASDSGEYETYILTGDRDSLQLISADTTVLLATNSDTVKTDEEAFFEKYGVKSSQFVDVKALMGDSSDNIPGVPGIGEKTALKLISEYGSLDRLYEALPTAELTKSVKAKLEAGRDSAYMSQTLARIFCEVPIADSLDEFATDGMDRQLSYELFRKYGFFKFIERFGLTDVGVSDTVSTAEAVTDAKPIEVIEIDPDKLKALCGCFAVSLDNGVLSVSDGDKIYRYSEKDGLDGFFGNNRIICYDCKQLYKSLEDMGIHYRGCMFDVLLGAYVDNSAGSDFGLARLILTYLGETVPESYPAALYIFRLREKLTEKLTASGQYELLMNIEMPLAGVLCDMELAGFKIDTQAVKDFGQTLDQQISELEERIFALAGCEFNINSPKQLGEVLFDKLRLPSGKKTKTGYSTNAEVLEKLRKYHPIIDDILEFRGASKLKGTYVDGLLKVADGEGRIHTAFRQTGTTTGRLSSAEPNLQNIPIRTEQGREMRKFFIPKDKDHLLIDADYSQIELRLLAAISGDSNMCGAFINGFDIHSDTACRVFGVTADNVSIEMRKKAKAINFGIMYGMGEFSLSQDLHISVAAAKQYINDYLSSYPAVDEYLSGIIEQAYRDGYVTTLFGRRRYIPELASQNKMLKRFGERVAMNSPIQGTAADIIKLAMINVDKELKSAGIDAKLILQVHDELIIEASRDCAEQAKEILKNEMENAVRLAVPLSVEAAVGESWFEAH